MEESTVLVEAVEKVSGKGLKTVLIIVGGVAFIGLTVAAFKAIKAKLAKRVTEDCGTEAAS